MPDFLASLRNPLIFIKKIFEPADIRTCIFRETSMIARLLVFFAIFLTAPAFAEEVRVPMVLEGGRVVTIDEAKALFDSGKTLFIDARNPLNYGRGHIPSAIAISAGDKDAGREDETEFRKRLPSDRNARMVFYSHGETGWKSYRAATMAVKAGYKNVLWMREGLKGWTAKGYPVKVGVEMEQR